jgi:hypothetical protein
VSALEALAGAWETEATHPALPGVVVRGRAEFEWLEGEKFLIERTWNEHPDFPDAIAIIGDTGEGLTMHYFDSRGVFRIYEVSAEEGTVRFARAAPGFDQRFEGTFADDGNTLRGLWRLSRDGSTWADDLAITYRRV